MNNPDFPARAHLRAEWFAQEVILPLSSFHAAEAKDTSAPHYERPVARRKIFCLVCVATEVFGPDKTFSPLLHTSPGTEDQ